MFQTARKVILGVTAVLLFLGGTSSLSTNAASAWLSRRYSPIRIQNAGAQPDSQANQELDVSKWLRIKNTAGGWFMRIPPDWEDNTPGEGDFGTSDLSYIRGPKNCYKQASRCALVGVRRFSPKADTSKQSLEGYLGTDNPHDQSVEFLSQRRFALAGESALDVCIKEKSTGVVRSREVVLKHHGALYNISYSEIGTDGKLSAEIRSPQDWLYMVFFDKMLETLSFYK